MRFSGKVAMVVGGAQGIGQGISLALGAEGAQVIVCDLNEDGAKATAKQVTDKGGKAVGVKVDVLNYDNVKDGVNKVVGQFGQLDICICTVGGGVFKPIKDYTPEFFRKQVDYNGFSVFNCFLAAMEPMVKRGYGKLLAFTSTTGGGQGLCGYGAGKAMVESLMKSFASELAQYKINVNCIMPGTTDTPLTRGAYAAMGPAGEKALEAAVKANPRGWNTPANVARLATFLVSDEAERLTSQVVAMR